MAETSVYKRKVKRRNVAAGTQQNQAVMALVPADSMRHRTGLRTLQLLRGAVSEHIIYKADKRHDIRETERL